MANNQENQHTEQIINKMGYNVSYPNNADNLCCGQFFTSNGHVDDANNKQQELFSEINNNLAKKIYANIIMDNSSCYYTLLKNNADNTPKIIDLVGFFAQNIDKLNIHKKYNKIALHIDCSCVKLGNQAQIMGILQKLTNEIVIPQGIACCGFAGTKGFTTPELNESALYGLATQIADCDVGVTFNQSCQIGLSLHGKKQYLSLRRLAKISALSM